MVRLYLALSETGILSSKVSVLFRIATSNEWEFLLPTFNVDFFICILYFIHSNRCVKVKVAQLCLTLCHPMDYTVHGQNTGVDSCSLLQGIFPTQGSNLGLPHCRWILYQLNHKGSPRILEWVAYPFFSASLQPRNWIGVSWIAGRFFTNWAIRKAIIITSVKFSSVQFSRSVVSDSLRPHESQHARPPCSSPSPRVHSDSRPSSPWCHPAIS